MSNGFMCLTSSGFSNEQILQSFRDLITENVRGSRVAIIVTASAEKERGIYTRLAKQQLEEMGFELCDFVDFETNPDVDLDSYKVFYVCGGNTFKLLKFSREADFDKSVKKLLERGGVYIGVSAGSILVGSSIAVAGEIIPDENEVELQDLTGLCVTSRIILPHYEDILEEDVKRFEYARGVVIDRVKDGEMLVLNDGVHEVIPTLGP